MREFNLQHSKTKSEQILSPGTRVLLAVLEISTWTENGMEKWKRYPGATRWDDRTTGLCLIICLRQAQGAEEPSRCPPWPCWWGLSNGRLPPRLPFPVAPALLQCGCPSWVLDFPSSPLASFPLSASQVPSLTLRCTSLFPIQCAGCFRQVSSRTTESVNVFS